MFHGLSELSLITTSFRNFGHKNTKAFKMSLGPFTNIEIAFIILPHATTIPLAMFPLPFVYFSIAPLVDPLAVPGPLPEVTVIPAPITAILGAPALFQIVMECALVAATWKVYEDSFALLPTLRAQFPHVYGICVFEDLCRRGIGVLQEVSYFVLAL